jgi:hypothetical protein
MIKTILSVNAVTNVPGIRAVGGSLEYRLPPSVCLRSFKEGWHDLQPDKARLTKSSNN